MKGDHRDVFVSTQNIKGEKWIGPSSKNIGGEELFLFKANTDREINR